MHRESGVGAAHIRVATLKSCQPSSCIPCPDAFPLRRYPIPVFLYSESNSAKASHLTSHALVDSCSSQLTSIFDYDIAPTLLMSKADPSDVATTAGLIAYLALFHRRSYIASLIRATWVPLILLALAIPMLCALKVALCILLLRGPGRQGNLYRNCCVG